MVIRKPSVRYSGVDAKHFQAALAAKGCAWGSGSVCREAAEGPTGFVGLRPPNKEIRSC